MSSRGKSSKQPNASQIIKYKIYEMQSSPAFSPTVLLIFSLVCLSLAHFTQPCLFSRLNRMTEQRNRPPRSGRRRKTTRRTRKNRGLLKRRRTGTKKRRAPSPEKRRYCGRLTASFSHSDEDLVFLRIAAERELILASGHLPTILLSNLFCVPVV